MGFIVKGKPRKSGKNKKNEITYKPNDKFVVLVEAQSKWNPNMTLRLLIYLAKTYQQYLIDTQQSEHSSAKVSLPKPELYVIYTGDDRKSVPSEISFEDDYFDGDAPIDLKVKILCKEDTSYTRYITAWTSQRTINGKRVSILTISMIPSKNNMQISKELIRIWMLKRKGIKRLIEKIYELQTKNEEQW